ncbi:hypothetical protein Tco_0877270 [Tanacetum coccineum]|uniref:Retrovirus-related Pol polyprotein from transposon TNT 1-94-like beta-barrel domain-containing protein n=1 Tax=Tanacetum coccineum TaxID=301880 RepID=A0ABQ5C0E0_9ASTR
MTLCNGTSCTPIKTAPDSLNSNCVFYCNSQKLLDLVKLVETYVMCYEVILLIEEIAKIAYEMIKFKLSCSKSPSYHQDHFTVVLEKDSEASKGKKEKYKSLALKAKKLSSDEEASCSDGDDEYAMAVRYFRKLFRRRGKFVQKPHDDKKNFRRAKEEKKGKEEQKCCWSDSEEVDDSKKDEICLMALDNNEVRLKVKLEPDEWIKDSGCSRHMTGNKDLFSSYEAINRGNVVFGSNIKSKIISKEPKNVKEAIKDESWTMAMQEELNQFVTNDVWSLVPPPED